MKILVINLLRIGDVLMYTPILEGINKKYPHAKIDLLINLECRKISTLLRNINKFYYFDRENIQKSLGTPTRSLFESYDRVNEFLTEVNESEYDLIINLTHNRLSGWLTTLIQGKEKIGFHFGVQGKPVFGSPWINFFNDYLTEQYYSPYHIVDVFKMALDLPKSRCVFNKINVIKQTNKKIISIQPLTSEEKKNWDLKHFVNLINRIHETNLEYEFKILCSKSEFDFLEKYFNKENIQNAKFSLCMSTFEEALNIIDSSEILLTLDTSIKHLAAGTKCKIVEINLGLSNPFKHGAYRENVIVLSPKSSNIEKYEELVFQVVKVESQSKFYEMEKILTNFVDDFVICKSEFLSTGLWRLNILNHNMVDENIELGLSQSTWNLLNRSSSLGQYDGFGKEAENLKYMFLSSADMDDVEDSLDFINREIDQFDERVNLFQNDLNECKKTIKKDVFINQLGDRIISYLNRHNKNNQYSDYHGDLNKLKFVDNESFFTMYRKIDLLLQESKKRNDIKRKLIRTVMYNLREVSIL